MLKRWENELWKVRKRQSNGIYAQASFGAEVESWWHREGSIASTGAERKRIS
jgi:hypothetical protein